MLGIVLKRLWKSWILYIRMIISRMLVVRHCEQYHLLKVFIEFDYGRRSKHPVLADDGLTMLDGVNVTLNEQQV
jgi:hypothetical protein